MTRPTLADVQADIDALPDEPESEWDPRLDYPLTKEEAYRAWPCTHIGQDGGCYTRRDEHADQIEGRFPDLDITDHFFEEA